MLKQLPMLALGVLAAIGGFLDIGELVFNAQAGALFQYQLLWVVGLAIIGGGLFAEMSGRIAAASDRPVFDLVRERLGFRLGLVTLVAAMLVNFLTLAAEVGGMALALRLLTGIDQLLLIGACGVLLLVVLLLVPFDISENGFSLLGLGLVVFAVLAWQLGPDWHQVANGFIPSMPHHHPGEPARHPFLVYAYFVVGIIGAGMTPYEVYFYSSGAREDHWTRCDMGVDKMTAIGGYLLGGGLAAAIVIVAAITFAPLGVTPQFLGTTAMTVQLHMGTAAFVIAVIGMFFAIGGAAFEACLSSGYALAQFLGWNWGQVDGKRRHARFVTTWLTMLVAAVALVATGADPIRLTEDFVIFAAVAMPLTFLPILLVADDPLYMGDYRNGWFSRIVGWTMYAIVVVVSIAAIPLMVVTHQGQG